MMPRSRDDFSESVRRAVAERAGYLCTNPECRRLTVGPHSVDGKSVSTGVAAHMAAAAPGGPRFHAEQSNEDRRSVDNAIWLCHSCGDLIDKDAPRFPGELLRRWRAGHEEFIRQGGAYPTLPTITLMTLQGLSPRTPPAGMAVTTSGDDIQRFRQHEIRLTNPNGRSIRYPHSVGRTGFLDGDNGVDGWYRRHYRARAHANARPGDSRFRGHPLRRRRRITERDPRRGSYATSNPDRSPLDVPD